jgi:hypothetical protein
MSPLRVLEGELGDIFWDLPPWITYAPGYDLGCTIYIANHTDEEREYALISALYRDERLLSEEALPVYGHTWFKVEPGDFVRIYGALRFDETDADLFVGLVERESNLPTDSVSTRLVAPAAAGALPPTWPGAPGAPGADWSSMLGMMMPIMMMGMLAMAIARPKEEKVVVAAPPSEERRLLPPGRRE